MWPGHRPIAQRLRVVEELAKFAEIVHAQKGLFITAVAEALSLGVLEAPGRLGADIVCGEAQSFGLPPAFGGPGLGFMACARNSSPAARPHRRMTKDVDGRRGFVLTLSTREQHIRREKATSNICTNQAWCALRASIFLETLAMTACGDGPAEHAQGPLRGRRPPTRAQRQAALQRPRLHEFAIELPQDAGAVAAALKAKGILGGVPLAPSIRASERPPRLRDRGPDQGNDRPSGRRAPGGAPMIREPLVFEISDKGKRAYALPALDVPESKDVLKDVAARAEIPGFPQVSEVEVVRHFTRLSQQNYCVDLGLYPLGRAP